MFSRAISRAFFSFSGTWSPAFSISSAPTRTFPIRTPSNLSVRSARALSPRSWTSFTISTTAGITAWTSKPLDRRPFASSSTSSLIFLNNNADNSLIYPLNHPGDLPFLPRWVA